MEVDKQLVVVVFFFKKYSRNGPLLKFSGITVLFKRYMIHISWNFYIERNREEICLKNT